MARRNVFRLLALLGALTGAAAMVGSARAQGSRSDYEHMRAQSRILLSRGRYDEALSTYGPLGREMGGELLRMIADAKRGGKADAALRLYKAYFDYHPFGAHDYRKEWNEAAYDYAALRQAVPEAAASPQAVQDIAVIGTYRQFQRYQEKAQVENALRLADEIVENYPLSLFCPAAAVQAGYACDQHRGRAAAIALLERYLATMRASGAPARSQMRVLLSLARRRGESKEAAELRKSLETYQALREMTGITYEKRRFLLDAAGVALKIADADSLALSRTLFGEFLAQYPRAPEAGSARMGILKSHLNAGQRGEALGALREIEKSPPAGIEFGPELLAVAQAHSQAKDYEAAISLCQEVTKRYPRSASALKAYLLMGATYDKLGDEARMLESFKAAARSSLPNLPARWEAEFLQSEANRRIAEHYTQRANWPEALRWWTAYKPRSSCGNCQAAMQGERAYQMAVCQRKLGRVDEALKTLSPYVYEPHWLGGPSLQISMMVVKIHAERGQLRALEPRLRQALAKSKQASGAKMALDYLALLRMAHRKDAAGLWAHLKGHPFNEYDHRLDWQTREAARLLVTIPEAKAFALRRLGGKPPESGWAAVLLARMKAAEILPILTRKITAERDGEALADYFYALTILGTDEAYGVVEHYATRADSHRAAAERVLKKCPRRA
jgi:tetratricopeptide (TPR) repeat protein